MNCSPYGLPNLPRQRISSDTQLISRLDTSTVSMLQCLGDQDAFELFGSCI